ncbi:MAG: helix-turn-helix domain-containing protein [Clostridium sp.]
MNERLKLLRSTLKLTTREFAKVINLSGGAITNMEKGVRNITDRVISDICREFNVNEEWLRDGKGEMFIEPDTFSLDEYLKQRKVSELEADIVKAYFDIPFDKRQELIENFKTNLIKKEKINETSCTIDEEVEAYRKELEAEQKGKISSASESQKENLG